MEELPYKAKPKRPNTGIVWTPKDDDLKDALEAYCEATGAAESVAIKMALRAALLGQDDVGRRMRSFSRPGARPPATVLEHGLLPTLRHS